MRKLLLPVFGLALVAGLTLASGVIHGRMSNRWGPSPDTLAAAKKLEEFPAQFGNWEMRSSEEMSAEAVRQLECAGYVSRTYVNQEIGRAVSVTVILGPPGPISVHTPEVCMSSRAYAQQGERRRSTIQDSEGRDHGFWALPFQSNDLDANVLMVCWAWSTGSRWTAAEDPRFVFAGQPYLYKVQLSSDLPPGTNPETDEGCREFLEDFVLEARNYVVEPSGD